MNSHPAQRSPFVILFLTAALALGPAVLVAADDVEDLKRENAALQERLARVERDLAAIKELLATKAAATPPQTPTAAPAVAPAPAAVAVSAQPSTPAVPTPSAAAPGFTEAETAKLKSFATMKGKPAHSSLDLNFYGYVKVDAAYDDSRFSVGNFARWAETESVLKNDSHFYLTANQTRLGIDLSGPTGEDFFAAGKVEIDFYGAGTGENKPEPMLRHACVRMDWPKSRFAVIAGQTWDIISPLNPTTVNYSVAWWQGNVGYRRPQIRLIKTTALARDVDLKIDAGISRTITGRKAFFKDANDPDTGADAGVPTLAARAGLSFPIAPGQVATLGVSGHIGSEEVHNIDLSANGTFSTNSINADLRLPLSPKLLLQAEAFIGRNFDSHLGGIGQGINLTLNREIDTAGGWAQLTLTPSPQWQFNVGAGVDDPNDADLTGSPDPARDARTKNSLIFGNATYSFDVPIQLSFELAWLRTTYKVNEPGEGMREQFAITYKF